MTRFEAIYRNAAREVARFVTPERQRIIARHNPGLAPERTDLGLYLTLSEKRYAIALQVYAEAGGRTAPGARALDAGGFLGAFPLALARMGMDVTLTEEYDYYEGAFDDLRDFLVSEGVRVWELDLTRIGAAPADESFDLVANMAMIEHLANSPKPLMDNLRRMLRPDGRLIVETPNIAYWPRRVQALKGQTVHPPLSDVYDSPDPFIGHHREYTAAELRELLERSGLRVERLVTFNYSWNYQGPLPARLKNKLVYEWPIRRFKTFREVLLACGSLRDATTTGLPD